MTKSLTEQWREGTLPCGAYYVNWLNKILVYLVTYEDDKNTHEIYEVLAPVPSYEEFVQQREFVKDHQNVLIENMNLKLKVEKLERRLYNKDQGFVPVLNIVLRNIESEQSQRKLTDLELTIKSQVKGVLTYNGLVSNTDESVQKMHKLEQQLAECIKFAQELCKDLDLEGILYPSQIEELEKIEKWGVK